MSVMEIYNETIRDLLEPLGEDGVEKKSQPLKPLHLENRIRKLKSLDPAPYTLNPEPQTLKPKL